jgi:hypothetical protein
MSSTVLACRHFGLSKLLGQGVLRASTNVKLPHMQFVSLCEKALSELERFFLEVLLKLVL